MHMHAKWNIPYLLISQDMNQYCYTKINYSKVRKNKIIQQVAHSCLALPLKTTMRIQDGFELAYQ